MRKSTAKNKGAQGCMKISSFFSKQTENGIPVSPQKDPKKTTTTLAASNEIITLDTDDEESPSMLNFKPKQMNRINKRKLDDNEKSNASPPLKKLANSDLQDVPNSCTQPSTSGLTTNNNSNEVSDRTCIAPSTSGGTPVKNNPTFCVKNVEKLLSPAALKEFNSPEKVMERFLDKAGKTITPVKLNFKDRKYSIGVPNGMGQNITPEKNESNSTFTQLNSATPKSRVKTPNKNSNKKLSGEKSTENSPSKQRKTPKKLFDRSPNNLNEFNVEVLRNFFKITPSKKEVEDREGDENKFTRKSLEVQEQNEKTPMKDIIPRANHFSPEMKVRTKLDFSKCGTPSKNADLSMPVASSSKNISHNGLSLSVQNRSEDGNKTIDCSKSFNSCEKENVDLNNLVLNFDDNWDSDVILAVSMQYLFNNMIRDKYGSTPKLFGQCQVYSCTLSHICNFVPNYYSFIKFVAMEYLLDLTESQHCKIVNVNHQASEIILTVKSTRTNDQAICTLQGFWIHSRLCIGDTVHVMATKLKDNSWLVDNQNGFLVFQPDFLLSVTSVVGSVFCKRKTVLQEKFRGYDGTNRFMVVGNMVHALLQEVLKNKLYDYKCIERCAQEILKRKEWVRQVYESGECLANIEQEFLIYVSKVHDFIVTYVINGARKVKTKPYQNDNWKGVISQIDDIEENIWCPDLGVKGKVDVSIKDGLETIPLEVKTGRASVSLQHRGQVLLYIMMMNKLGYKVSTGLLLYLKDGVIKEIPPTASEKRDIMILRNELAFFLSRNPNVVKNSEETYLEPGEVPEATDNHTCSKCPYNAICMAYSKGHGFVDICRLRGPSMSTEVLEYCKIFVVRIFSPSRHTNEDMSSKKSLVQVHSQLSTFLTSAHIDYFIHWSCLLDIEMSERNGPKNLRDIYTLSPNERKNKGRCLINLKVTDVSEDCNGTFSHTFMDDPSEATNFLLSGFFENSYVVVSVEDRPAIATGFISDISAGTVIVSLDKNLNKKYLNRTFFLDAYDSTSFLTFNMASLALILNSSERSNQLRSIVVDKQPASFQPKLPKLLADKAKPILKRLNRVQQRAVLKALAANEYFLIKGMPGTGKTATIVALIQLLLELNKSVLITSHTHSAVDNVCLKLIQFGVKFMRLGSEAKMDAKLKEYSEHNLTKECSTPKELERVYNEAQVLAVTCLGSGHPALSKRILDICIVDESTQVLQCSVFRPLHAAKTFILIGDPDQLPAVVRNRDALELGMNESLFERLNSEESRITLNLNYRMNEPITGLANALTYNGELLIGADRIATATLTIPKLKELTAAYQDKTWLLKALDTSLKNAVQFIDTGPVWNINKNVSWARTESYEENSNEHQKCVNIYEAAIIFHLVHALVNKGGVTPAHIGVICTYRAQVAQLFDLLQSTTVDVNTVDQFQGKDKSIVIYSCSKSRDFNKKQEPNKHDLLEDKRRLNVAITRAKHKLLIVGDFVTLHDYSTFKKIQEYLEKNVIRITEHDDFIWDNVLDLKVGSLHQSE